MSENVITNKIKTCKFKFEKKAYSINIVKRIQAGLLGLQNILHFVQHISENHFNLLEVLHRISYIYLIIHLLLSY